jgi:chromosomal replication initiation ATPase DnaA
MSELERLRVEFGQLRETMLAMEAKIGSLIRPPTGREIIKAVMEKHGVGPKDFFGATKLSHIVEARRVAMKQMLAVGMTKRAIGRVMKRNHTTVSYWTCPGQRDRRRDYYKARKPQAAEVQA